MLSVAKGTGKNAKKKYKKMEKKKERKKKAKIFLCKNRTHNLSLSTHNPYPLRYMLLLLVIFFIHYAHHMTTGVYDGVA